MGPGQVLSSFVSFLVQGSSSNWYGLSCPGHCSGSTGWTVAIGVCGFFLATLFTFRHILFTVPASACMNSSLEPAKATAPKAPADLRLRGYALHGSGAGRSITDLQEALERLRIAVDRQSARPDGDWEVVASSEPSVALPLRLGVQPPAIPQPDH